MAQQVRAFLIFRAQRNHEHCDESISHFAIGVHRRLKTISDQIECILIQISALTDTHTIVLRLSSLLWKTQQVTYVLFCQAW